MKTTSIVFTAVQSLWKNIYLSNRKHKCCLVVCRTHVLHLYLCYLCLFVYYSGVKHVLTIWVSSWRVFYKRQKLNTLHKYLGSPPVYGGVYVPHLFSFLCRVVFCFLFLLFVPCLVCQKFPVSLDCSFLIVPSVFFNVYKYK